MEETGEVRSITARTEDGKAVYTVLRMSYEHGNHLDDWTLEEVQKLFKEFTEKVLDLF
jgi:hypothetical protein